MKTIALLSGGLDSTLAAKLILDQGIEVQGLSFLTIFNSGLGSRSPERSPGKKAGDCIGVPVTFLDHTDTMIALVKSAPHGHGSNLNPCIDCHMAMLRKAGALMEEMDAQFITTGEVLGQRPMSQNRRALPVIDKGAGLEGRVVRPLSARCLPVTIPEEEGWLDHEKLLDISGRGRTRQMALAGELGITDYPHPAGGCLLTDPGFCQRLSELMKHDAFPVDNAELLKVGRHFRLSPGVKLVIARHKQDCGDLATLVTADDVFLQLADVPGPLALIRGEPSEEDVRRAAAFLARYSRLRDEATVRVRSRGAGRAEDETIEVTPCDRDEPERWSISNG